ncbi:hypothetical protein HK097_001678 [Rhizophlyctis rosea]|uniref:Uncharacterized protein n=1 Tax=Rhizophlyctis rosea TaxID=64517 RepID=A0AAD5X3F5_9FUNG|nr:hypothetical protein HK097_001678 [Rhizophlyctis rosea]
MPPENPSKKRPLDLAALRQRQLQSRKRRAVDPAAKTAPTDTPKSSSPKSVSPKVATVPTPLLAVEDIPVAARPLPPTKPSLSSENPVFSIFGQKRALNQTKSSLDLNPFARKTVGLTKTKKPNPFQVLRTLSNAETEEDSDAAPKVNVSQGIAFDATAKAGHHVINALREPRRTLSCPADLFSSNATYEPKPLPTCRTKVESWTLDDDASSGEGSVTSEDEEQSVILELLSNDDLLKQKLVKAKESPETSSPFMSFLKKGSMDMPPLDSADAENLLRLSNAPINSSSVNSSLSGKTQPGTAHPPLDWTLKSSATFTSDVSFAWCSELNSAEDSANLISFVAQAQSGDKQTAFQHCLYHWIYPVEVNSPTRVSVVIKILGKLADKASLEPHEETEYKAFLSLEETWKRAFRSLYYITRNGQSAYFYYISSEFSVLFFGEDAKAGLECEAILSRSTAGIRKQLQKDDINFEVVGASRKTPLPDEIKMGKSLEHADADEDTDFLKAQEVAPRMQKDNEDASTLRFVGHSNVHGLFDFLLNWKEPRTERRAERFPTLLAPSPFLNGCLQSAEVTKNGQVRNATRRTSGSDALAIRYNLKLSGYILPSSAAKLLEIMRKSQKGGIAEQFSAHFRTDSRTIGLNGGVTDVRNGDSGSLKLAKVDSVICEDDLFRAM